MNELVFDFRQDGEQYLYEQIYEYIKQEIRKGKLPKGEKLPSTRSLAEFLQISRSTAELAYEQLLSEGYIESKPYKGYYVCGVEELFNLFEEKNGVRAGEIIWAEGEEIREKAEEYLCDFSPGAIDMSAFPFSTWKKITKGILVDANSEMFSAGAAKGDLHLRETVAKYLYSARGVNCIPQQIIVGAGNDYLLLLLEKILGRHVKIAMENPTYKRAYRIFDSFAYTISPVPMDSCGMQVKELNNSGADVAYVMPSHQYPTGIVMPIRRRLELLNWAMEKDGRYLIEDDYDSEFRYRGKPVPSLQASDRNGKVIYIGTFSKSIAPAIRISYMVLPVPLLRIYEHSCFFYSSTVSRIDQRILNEFIANGYFERYLNKMRKIYREKHDWLLEELKVFGSDFEVSGEGAGLHILLTDNLGRTEKQLTEQAAAAGIKVYGLSENYIGKLPKEENKNTIVLGYAALCKKQITEGIRVLKKVWK